MWRMSALLILCTAASGALATDSTRPRGVGPEFAKFYKKSDTFTCISTPSIVLSASQINDNYCDCPDGSDEPGTSACTYLSPLSPLQPVPGSKSGNSNVSNALPGFWCKNKGHVGNYIDFTLVNDGICDYDLCCDGSDEWEGVGGVKCEDRCKEMGKEWRKKEKAREKASLAAGKKRAELVKEAAAMRVSVQENIGKLEGEIADLERKEAEAKRNLEDVERRERGRILKGASAKASRVTVLAKLAKARVEELREALIRTVERKDAAAEKVKQLEGILTSFKEDYNPNFNDEGVKRAVKAWEDYAANRDSTVVTDSSAEERDIEDISKPDTESEGINWAEWEKEEEESDVEALYRFEEYLPPKVRDWIHKKIFEIRALLIKNGILADNESSSEEPKAVTAARSTFKAFTDSISDKERQLNDAKEDLSKDYGADDVFRALKGKCVEQDSGEYTYELCWLDRTAQKSKKGGGSTGMGNFVGFDTMEVDDEVSADGKGLGSGLRTVLLYDNGQYCWNGPNRKTTVVLACAEKDEIWRVAELEKCVYRMEVGTPAVCEPKKTTGKEKDGEEKGEL